MLNQYQTIKDNIAKYNKPNPLADFLLPFIGDKREVSILDVGSGPYSIIGNYLDGVKVELVLGDNQIFDDFWEKYDAQPFLEVEWLDMEDIDCPDDTLDIVTCINALDHTNDAEKAAREMIRVCKPEGWVYIDCHLDQLNTGHKHKWNAKPDGRFTNKDDSFNLKDFGFTVKFIDNGGESRYNRIIATLQK
jgi:ubiquinone/menaquinone biosynthesis C-methylase UbiE